MTITAHADILGAITARLRTFNEITTLTSTRIGGEIGDDWFPGPDAQGAIYMNRAGGIPNIDDWVVGKRDSRIDCNCYGSSKRAAERLMATVLAALCPDGSGRVSFKQSVTVAANTTQTVTVYSIIPEVDTIVGREPDTGYRYAFCPLIVSWSSIPA